MYRTNLNLKPILLSIFVLTAISINLYAECDFMAMLAKDGHQIYQFYDTDYYFDFQEGQSCASKQEDGYGVIYYKNNQDTIHFDYDNPLAEDNQAFYLIGPKNSSWYGCHGPDAFGKYYNDSNHPDGPNYSWIDLDNPTQVEFSHNDSASVRFSIGFNFEFYGEVYDSLIINPNGWISFADDNDQYKNTDVYNNDPVDGISGPAIFGFWDDLNPVNEETGPNVIPGSGYVYYEYQSNYDRLVIFFDDVVHWQNAGNPFVLELDFQIIIWENGNIKFQYRDVTGNCDSATIGIKAENSYADSGFFQIVCNGEYVEDSLAVLFSTDVYDDPEPLDIVESRIMNSDYEAVIVLGHDRDRGRTAQYAAGQHPYRFEWNNKTYTFQHNGSQNAKQEMIDYCETIDPDWFEIHPLNWVCLGNDPDSVETVGDTELLFHYIMSRIIEYEGDIVNGMISALNETDLEGYNFRDSLLAESIEVNIVLSNGEALYVFRNTEFDELNPDRYNLSYKDYGDFVGVKTSTTIAGETPLGQYSLVVIPRVGEITTYDNIFYETKTLSSGWNWESFPRLERDETINEEIDIVPIMETIEPNNLISLFFDANGQNDLEYDIFGSPYQWTPQEYYIQSTFLYKIDIDPNDERTLVLYGTRMAEDFVIEDTLGTGEYHWLGYWLSDQDIDDAFGGFWDKVKVVKAEEWTWMDMTNPRDPQAEPKPSMKIRPLEYGKGYMVKFKEEVVDFHWNWSGLVVSGYERPVSGNFLHQEKPDYEVIDVLEIDPEITEIGVFQDSVCVGAVAVRDSAEQILVYSDNANRDPVPFTIEVTTGRGTRIPIIDYSTLNLRTGKFENKPVIHGRQEYSAIKLGEKGEPVENAPIKVQLHRNYPNPFNPTTTILFSLPKEEVIELIIFNIKGQKVKTLFKGNIEAGKHKAVWNGKDANEKPVSSGVYFYKLKAGKKELIRKMLMLK